MRDAPRLTTSPTSEATIGAAKANQDEACRLGHNRSATAAADRGHFADQRLHIRIVHDAVAVHVGHEFELASVKLFAASKPDSLLRAFINTETSAAV